jgi:hypothetical protein
MMNHLVAQSIDSIEDCKKLLGAGGVIIEMQLRDDNAQARR